MGGPRPVTCATPDELRSALEADYKARAEEKDPCAFVAKALLVVMIAVTLTLRLNEPLAAALISSVTSDASASPALAPGALVPILRGTVISRPVAAFVGYVAMYMALQVLSIPGCVALNAVAGATLGVGLALPLTVAMTAIGSTLCYWGSRTFAGAMLLAYLPDRLSVLRPLVATAKSRGGTVSLVHELTFLRILPFVPAWVLNMAAPHVGVGPVAHFASAMLGSVPGCLCTVVLGGDIEAAVAAPDIYKLPASVRIRLLTGVFTMLAPLGLRQYCHLKSESVAGYSDLYEDQDSDANAVQGLAAGDAGAHDAVLAQEKKKRR